MDSCHVPRLALVHCPAHAAPVHIQGQHRVAGTRISLLLLQVRSLTEKIWDAESKHSTEVSAVVEKFQAMRSQVEGYHHSLFTAMDSVPAC